MWPFDQVPRSFSVVLPQAKSTGEAKLLWAALITRKDGSSVDSLEEILKVYITVDPNNLHSWIF